MKRAWVLFLAVYLVSLFPSQSWAAEGTSSATAKRVTVVAKSALYGFGGGLVVGVASQVFHKKAKNIFMFGSLGLYAGILLGIYVISTSSEPRPYEGPDTYEDYSSQREVLFGPLARSEMKAPQADLQMNILDVKF